MADINLTKPAAGQHSAVQTAADSRIVLNFPTDQATMEKEGDNLVFKFDDGSKVELENFYQQYNAEAMPEFEVDGQLVAGADFFNAFGPDLSPAAGPGGGAQGGHRQEYTDLGLADGINHLRELDWGMKLGGEREEHEYPLGTREYSGIEMNWTNPWDNGNPPPSQEEKDRSAAYAEGGKFVLKESHLAAGDTGAHGSQWHEGDGPVSATSQLHITTVNSQFTSFGIAGKNYDLNTLARGVEIGLDLDGDGEVDVTVVFRYTGNNNIEVTVTLDNSVTHIDNAGNLLTDALAGLNLTAHDNKGNSASGSMSVDVVDDNPEANDDAQRLVVEHTQADGTDAMGQNEQTVAKGNVLDGKGTQIHGGSESAEFETGVDGKTGADISGADGYHTGADGKVDGVTWDTQTVTTDNAKNADGKHADQDFHTNFYLTGDGPKYTVMDHNGDKVVGEITLNADGSYTFEVNVAYEPEHGDHTINIPYSVTDSDGDKSDAVLHITIENVNDRPVFVTPPDTPGDPDHPTPPGGGDDGDPRHYASTGSVKETGVWGKDGGERDSMLHDGKHGTDDENAGTVDGGTADGRHLTVVTGHVSATDADQDVLVYGISPDGSATHGTNGLLYVVADANGGYHLSAEDPGGDNYYGTIQMGANGEYTFTLNNECHDVDRLGEGDHKDIIITVTATDNSGQANDTGTGEIKITVHGTNDAPTLKLEGNNLTVVEDAANNAVSGWARGSDVDDGASLTYSLEAPDGSVVQTLYAVPDGQGGVSLSTTAPADGNYYGTYTIDQTSGEYRFTVNNSAGCVQELGEHTTQSMPPATVVVQDEHGAYDKQDLNVSIQGSNDTPKFDTNDRGFAGQGDVKETGVWGKDGGERDGMLHDGKHGTDDENASTKDGGTADGQHQLSASGQLHATDVDKGDTLSYGAGTPNTGQSVTNNPDGSYTIHDQYGDLTINKDGSWTFSLNDGAADHLGEGQNVQIKFPVIVQDNSGAANDTATGNIAINIHGTNDAPTLGVPKNLEVTEGTANKLGGAAGATIVNDTGSTSVAGKVIGSSDRDDGETATLKHGLLDTATGKVVSVLYVLPNPNGQGDYPYILSAAAPADGSQYGKFEMKEDGSYTFTLNNSANCVQSLNEGDKPHFDVPIVVQDKHGAYDKGSVGVDIVGKNDAPFITGGTKGAVKEDGVWGAGGKERDGFLHDGTHNRDDENAAVKDGGIGKGEHKHEFEGKLEAADVDDAVSSLTFGPKAGATGVEGPKADGSYVMHGTYGDLTINPDGSYKYVLDEAKAQSLTEGQKVTENFPVTVTDPHGGAGSGNINIDVHGTNDAPKFAQGQYTNTVLQEDGGNYKLTGQVVATDPDAGETAKLTYGFEAPDGSVVQTLYAVPDGSGGIAFSTTQPGDGNYFGVFTINSSNGSYTFQMNNEAKCTQGLGAGETADIHVPVVVQDPHGAYDKSDLNVKIDGSNDKASIDMNALNPSQTVIEEGVKPGGNIDYAGVPTAKGTLHATDPDIHDDVIYKVQDVNGGWHTLGDTNDPAYDANTGTWSINTEHGKVEFSPSANSKYPGGYDYTYTLNNADTDVNALNREERMPDGFGVKVENQNGDSVDANVKITIVGTNDRPHIDSNEITIALTDPDNAIDGVFGGRIATSDPDKEHVGSSESGQYNLTVTGEGGKNFVDVYGPDGRTIVGYAEIKPDGTYKISLNDTGKALLREKAEGEYLDVSTNIRVTDPLGAYDETRVQWHLEGKDDAPLLSNPSVSMKEDGWLSGRPVILDSTGKLVPNPAYAKDDRPDSINGDLHASRVDTTDAGAGDFTYSLGHGAGLGNGPLYVNTDGSLTTDRPSGDYLGTVTLDPQGHWTFNLNQDSDTVNKLQPGQSLDVNIPTNVDDGRGYNTDGNIHIKVNGTNDRPTIEKAPDLTLEQHRDDNGNALHDKGSYTVSGHAVASDPDNVAYRPSGETDGNLGGTTGSAGASEITFCFIDPKTGQPTQSLQLEHGSVTIDPKTGEYTYTYDVFNNANYDSPNGDGRTSYSTHDDFTIYARDKDGAYSNPEDVKVDVGPHDKWGHGTGPGDGTPPTLNATGDTTVKEDDLNNNKQTDPNEIKEHGDGSVVAHGNISGDTGYYFVGPNGAHVQSVPAEDANHTRYGTWTIDPITGDYKLILDNGSDRVQELNEGEKVLLTPPTVGSWNGGSTTIGDASNPPYLMGTNDAPEFRQDVYGHTINENAAQNGGQFVNGSLQADDLDKGDTLTYGPKDPAASNVTANSDGSHTIAGKYGDLTVKPDGTYHYEVRNGVNIPHGAHEENFNVIVTDSHGATDDSRVHIDLNGLNTPPVYHGSDLSITGVKEDTNFGADGYITGRIDGLTQDKFTDADGDRISFSVAPDKDGDGHADRGGAAYAVGQYGTLFIKSDGSYEYRLNNNMDAVQGLKDGQSIHDKFVVIGSDGYGGTVEIPLDVKIDGTNDNPVLSLNDKTGNLYGGGVSLDMVEGQTAIVGGKAVATDADTDDNYFRYSFKDSDGSLKSEVNATATINGQEVVVGKFVIDPDTGAYKFIPDPDNLAPLKGGEQIKVGATVVVESSDHAIDAAHPANGGQTEAGMVVNITGTNDAPTLNLVVIDRKEDSGDYVANGKLTAVDPDADAGDKASFSVKAGDGVTQTGPNTWEGKYGTLVLNPDGSYNYTLHNDKVQSLGEGEHAHDYFTIIAKDKYGAASTTQKGIDVDIEGTNDAPVLANISPVSVMEGAATPVGQFKGSDVDAHDTLTYSVEGGVDDASRDGFDHSVAGQYGTLYYNSATGAHQYVADNAERLSQGEKAQDHFNVKVSDQHGASAGKGLDVNLTGTNQAPTLEPIASGATSEGGAYVTGTFAGHDVDAHDTLTYSVPGAVAADASHAGFDKVVHGQHGDLYYNSSTGAYQYEAGHGLGQGQTGNESFTVSVNDGHGGTASQNLGVTVTGTNDAPTLSAMTTAVDQNAAVSGHFAGHDVDAGDTLTYSVANAQSIPAGDTGHPGFDMMVHGAHGNLYYNSGTGAYQYEASEATQHLGLGESASANFNVTVTDGSGASASNSLNVTINGTNDAPTISVSEPHAALDADQHTTVNGQIVFTDTDINDELTLSVGGQVITEDGFVIHGQYGDLTVNLDGSYSYEIKDMNALANAGEDGLKESFTAGVNDGHGMVDLDGGFDITVTHNGVGVVGDAVVGTAADDLIMAGNKDIYGGAGNDVFVFTAGSSDSIAVDGGAGLDVMLIAKGFDGQLDTLLSNAKDVELVVQGVDPEAANDLTSIGITVNETGVSLSSAWTAGTPDANGNMTYTHSNGEAAITVAATVTVEHPADEAVHSAQSTVEMEHLGG